MVPQHPCARRRPASPRGSTAPSNLLDAGCGPGGNGAWLAEHGDVVGVDLVRPRPWRSCAHAVARPDAGAGEPRSAAVRRREPTTRSSALTVLYCVPDDATAVRELARVTRPRRRGPARRTGLPRAPPCARRDRPRTTSLPSRGRSPSWRPRLGSPCNAAPTPTPSSPRRRRRSRASTDCVAGAIEPGQIPTSTSARSTGCSRRSPTRERAWLAHHDVPVGYLGRAASLPADRRGPATTT